jgi:hypothetical protein
MSRLEGPKDLQVNHLCFFLIQKKKSTNMSLQSERVAQLEASNELQVTWLHCLPFRLTKPTNSTLQSEEDLRGFLAAYEDALTASLDDCRVRSFRRQSPRCRQGRGGRKPGPPPREVEDLKKQLQGEQLARQRNDRDLVFLINTVHKLQGALSRLPLERSR